MFFLMIYISYILCNNDLDISEQCIYVRCRNKINYYLYKVICVLIFSIVLNLILFTSACLFSIGSKNALTIILWYISAVSVGFCGGAMGQMFHPAIINDRKFSTVFIILISTLCACKTNILNSQHVLHYLFFISANRKFNINLPNIKLGRIYNNCKRNTHIFNLWHNL